MDSPVVRMELCVADLSPVSRRRDADRFTSPVPVDKTDFLSSVIR